MAYSRVRVSIRTSINLWNSMGNDIRKSDSPGMFKKRICFLFEKPSPINLYHFSLHRYSSVLHARLDLCLNACVLNLYLFKLGNKPSVACFFGSSCESVKHYLLSCRIDAAQRSSCLSLLTKFLQTCRTHNN